MADEEHLRILRQGVGVWNQWREAHRDIRPDFSEVDLREVNLREADLQGADLHGASLAYVDLTEANLADADLHGAHLGGANFFLASLHGADLHGASLGDSDLGKADLDGADLRDAYLGYANLHGADLRGTDLDAAIVGWTVFADVNLSVVKGLESVKHTGPSTIGIDTIYASRGRIPEVFLRGAGVPDEFITYMRSLVGRAIEFYSCFISYSSKDQEFAERLYADLRAKGVYCWFALEDMKTGDKIRPRIDEAIRHYDKLLLLLSANSVESTWVEKEVETAFEEESRRKRAVLFPVRLDDSVMQTGMAWAADIRRTRHIGDFRTWKDRDAYRKAFGRLLRDLKAEESQR